MKSNRFRILFLIFVVLGVYYPVLFSEINSVDDSKLFTKLGAMDQLDWKRLFMPGGGYYYRPLLMLTFFADKYLWDLTESFMHLENVLLHAVNTVLVFLLGSKIFRRFDAEKLELPLLSALLFAVHPVNTEPVAWISGRTDPLATLFVLLSVIALLKGLSENRYLYLIVSNLLLLLGCMSKEVAVFFLPAACLITLYWQNDDEREMPVSLTLVARIKQLSVLVLPSIVGGVSYLGLRFFAIGRSDTGILQIFRGNTYDFLDMFRVCFKVLGFYVKKLFLPLPLNFAITKISDNYVWLGVAVFLLLILIAFKRNLISAFLITACYLIAPAILVASSRIAWTPLAERYLYLPTAFFAIGMVGGSYLVLNRFKKELWLVPCVILVLLPATFFTSQRTLIWQDNLALFKDTREKSPDFLPLRNELAIALMADGKSAEADAELELGKKLDPKKRNVLFYVNQAVLNLKAGKPEEARAILLEVAKDKKSAKPDVLKMLAKIDERRLFTVKTQAERREVYKELMDTHDHLYPKTGDPMSLYRGGQMALFLGETKRAGVYFQRAYDAAPEGTFYKPAAKKLADKFRQ